MAKKQNQASDLTTLRGLLFDTINNLNQNQEPKPIDIDKANTIAHLAGKIMETGKIQLDYTKALGKEGSADDFFGKSDQSKW